MSRKQPNPDPPEGVKRPDPPPPPPSVDADRFTVVCCICDKYISGLKDRKRLSHGYCVEHYEATMRECEAAIADKPTDAEVITCNSCDETESLTKSPHSENMFCPKCHKKWSSDEGYAQSIQDNPDTMQGAWRILCRRVRELFVCLLEALRG